MKRTATFRLLSHRSGAQDGELCYRAICAVKVDAKLRRCGCVCLGFASDSATCPRAWASTGPWHVGQMLGP